jgi:hypothetical protein
MTSDDLAFWACLTNSSVWSASGKSWAIASAWFVFAVAIKITSYFG